MHRHLLLFALCGTGCYALTSNLANTASINTFEEPERSRVYARSLTAFQGRGLLIAISEPNGGLLRTERQRSPQTCSNVVPEPYSGAKTCWAMEQTQLTIGADGNAFLRTNRTVFGTTNPNAVPMNAKDHERLQQESNAMLDFIVGHSPQAPALPPEQGLLPQ